MNCTSHCFSYAETGAFPRLVTDYLERQPALQPFYQELPTLDGIQNQLQHRRRNPVNRSLLVAVLQQQYKSVPENAAVMQNINRLLQPKCFTITTAHQPNLFTGPLYFIYKILHTIRLAEWLGQQLPNSTFVPVFYMGTEDADFEELSHCTIKGNRLQWHTSQTGAFGRMILDANSQHLLQQIEGLVGVTPHGAELMIMLRSAYSKGASIQEATFAFVHALFAKWGLVVLLPDQPELKRVMQPVFRDELLHQRSHAMVTATVAQLGSTYKVQAGSRPINLFYLHENLRERIELHQAEYRVLNSTIRFTQNQILDELQNHPERFSPNVILRGLYQEMLLPNVAFVGGGGELAYWLELKNVFVHYEVPFPVLVLRNSFLLLPEAAANQFQKWGFGIAELFKSGEQLLTAYVQQQSEHRLQFQTELDTLAAQYQSIESAASAVDSTLQAHVRALHAQAEKRLKQLEKKMVRAEKRKFSDMQRQLQQFKNQFFPANGLQERSESMLGYYAQWGSGFLDELYNHALALEQQFSVLVHASSK